MTMSTTVLRSIFICLFAVAMLLPGPAHTSEAHAANRPNVILIMTDDQGYGDFGAKGNQAITTPHLDRLAAGGASATDFYVHPEIVQQLKNAYDAWFDDVSTTRPDNFAPPRIILGSTENPTKLTRQDLRDGPWLGYHPDHDPGYWPVTVASDGRYDVLVIIAETIDAPQLATVHIGDEPVTRTVAPHLDMCLISGVPMSAGDHDFIITLTAGEASVPPHQVIVTRRSPSCGR